MASIEQIKSFVEQILEADEIIFIPTEKYRETKYLLGFTDEECEYIVRSLTNQDYHRGPLDDHDTSRSGKVWIFKTRYKREVLYIKLKEIEIIENNKIMKCLSCHIDYIEV